MVYFIYVVDIKPINVIGKIDFTTKRYAEGSTGNQFLRCRSHNGRIKAQTRPTCPFSLESYTKNIAAAVQSASLGSIVLASSSYLSQTRIAGIRSLKYKSLVKAPHSSRRQALLHGGGFGGCIKEPTAITKVIKNPKEVDWQP